MGSSKFVLLCALVTSAVAVPLIQREQCARHCTERNQFNLKPGSTYTYDYETTSATTIQGTTREKSQLQMTAQVDIEVLSKCELSLRLRGVTLKQSDPQSPDYLNPVRGGREFSHSVEQHILKFSYQDGQIEHLCPTENTPAWVTNIHRGVLSAFQTSMADLHGNEKVIETDVSGKCTAEYKSLGRNWRGTTTIRKVKDFNSCTDRNNADTAFQGTPYADSPSMKTLPMVTGSQECEQSIGSGILESSSCVEKHIFRPFSQGGKGAITAVTQKLTFSTISKRSFTGNDYRPTRKGLLFDHEYEEKSTGRKEQEAQVTLIELCEASKQEMAISVPNKFAAFVYKLRKLDYQALDSFYGRLDSMCPENPKVKKFFMDAVPLLSTSSSVRFMANIIARQEIPKSETDFWLTSLSFISEPSSDMIAILTPLLEGQNDQAFLGISALIHTFCKTNDCSRTPEVRDAVYKLIDSLGENCYNSEVTKVLLTLKALGNIGQIFGKESILEKCYSNPQVKTEVRLAAIQAYRRLSCDVKREDLLLTYMNYNEDTEIRTAAYLAIMKCPTSDIIQSVKETLEKELVNQVGSFVWTHLNAVSKSKHPERKDIKDILSSIYFLNKYNSDIRKFSSAHEATLFLESINSGFHVDSHVIFTPESYLPRSATFNLTVDIFGHTCNLLQLDGRMEGLEQVVERFFGPSGYLPQREISKFLRERRSISDNKIDQFDKQFDAKTRFDKLPYGSMDMKIFGNTLLYKHFGGDGDDITTFNLLDLVTELGKGKVKEYSRSFMFLDTTFTIPLSSGFPLKLAVNGTANVGLKIGGKFNVKLLQNVDILGHFEPSGAVEIATLLSVDAGMTARSGMRMIATLHSSTFIDGKIEIQNGEVIKAQVNMPKDRIDVIDIQSKLYLVHGSDETEQRGVGEDATVVSSCSGEMTKRVLGVELCTKVQLPGGKKNTPMYPINGPATLSVYIQKTDPSLKSYTFDAQWNKENVNGEYVRRGIISLNTPDTTTDREVMAEFHLNQLDHTASFNIKTPVKKFGASVKYLNEKASKKLDLSVIIDDEEKFSLQSEYRVENEKGSIRYTPKIEIRIPSRRLAYISGSAYLRHGQKYSGHLTIEGLTKRPLEFRGDVDQKNRDRYEGKFSLNSFALTTTAEGYVQLTDTLSSRLSMDYSIMEGQTYKITVNGKVRDLSANALTKYNGVINMQATAIPEWDTAISWETMKTTGHFENSLSISIGDEVRSKVHTINMQQILRYQGDIRNNNAAVSLKLFYPERKIDYSFDMKHENTPRSIKNVLTVKYDTSKEISTLVDLSMANENLLSLSSDVRLQYPGRESKLLVEVSESNPQEYRTTMTVQWQRGKQINFVGNYKDGSDVLRTKYEADAQLIFPERAPMTFSTTFGSSQGQYAALMEANLGHETYRLNTEYIRGFGLNHRMTGQLICGRKAYAAEVGLQSLRDKIVGNLDLKFPSRRHVTSKLEIRNSHITKTLSFESMWDADRDQNSRIAVDSELHIKLTGYEGKATIQIPRRTVRGSFSCSTVGHAIGGALDMTHKAEIEWSPKEKISVSLSTKTHMTRSHHQVVSNLDITTPFRGYETMTFNLDHLDNDQQWNSQISTSWANSNRIVLSSEGKYSTDHYGCSLYANAKLQTPYRGWESLSFDITHARGPSEMSSRAEIQWSYDKKIAAGFFGSISGYEFRGGANLTTPFMFARDLSAIISHAHTSGNIKTKGEVNWASNKKISIEIDAQHSLSGRRRTCSVNLMTFTPFRGYETTSTKLVYNSDGIVTNTDVEFNFNRDKITFGFNGSRRNARHNRNLDGKLYFNSPYRGYENLQITSTLQISGNSYKTNIDVQLPHRMTASLNTQGKMVSWNEIEMNIVVNGKFNNYVDFQRASVDLAHKFQNSNLRSTLDAVYGNKQITVLLTGMINPRAGNAEGTLTINTPFTDYEEIKLDLTHNQRDSRYLSRMEVSKNRENFALYHDLLFTDALNFGTTFKITSTFISVREIKASINQQYSSGNFKHDSELSWEQVNKITLNTQYQGSSASKELSVKLATPFHQLRDLDIIAHYEEKKREYKPSLAIQWNGNRRISLEGNLVNYRMQRIVGNLLFTSPFFGHELYQVTGKYDLTNPRKTGEIKVQWDRRKNKIASLIGSYQSNDLGADVEISLSTPFDEFDVVSLVGNYDIKQFEKSASLVYQRGWKKITLSAKSLVNFDGAEYEASFTSPYEHAKFLSTNIRYAKGKDQINGDASIQWGTDKKISLSGEYDKENVNGKISLTTPFQDYESMSLNLKSDTNGPKRNVEIYIIKNDEKLDILADLKVIKGQEMVLNIKIRSPFRNYKEVTLHSYLKYDPRKYDAEVKLQLSPRNIYKGSLGLKRNGHFPEELTFKMDSPIHPFKNIRLTMNLICQRDHHEMNSKLEFEDKMIDVSTYLRKRSNNLYESKLKINTPFERFTSISVEGTLRNDDFRFVDVHLNIVTPFDILRSLDLAGQLKNNNGGYELSFNANTPSKKLNVSAQLKNSQFQPFEASFKVEAPFTSFQTFSVSANINSNGMQSTKATFLVASGRSIHSLAASFEKEVKNVKLEIILESPLLQSGTAKLEAAVDYIDIINFEGQLVTSFIGNHKLQVNSKKDGRRENQMEVKIESPLLPHKQAAVKIVYTHRQNRNFDGKIDLSFQRSSHQLSLRYDIDNRQFISNFKVESNLLPVRTLSTEFKYINVNGRDLEISLLILTPGSRHSIIGNMKNYDSEKYLELKVNCPLIQSDPFSITGKLKHGRNENMEGTLTINCHKKELRLAGNIMRTGLDNVNVMLTLNTPFEPLRMVRVDAKLSNENFQNIEGNLQIETSNAKFRKMGFSGKLIRTNGFDDLSMTAHLPIQDYNNIGLLANVHYNADMTTIAPRLTLSLPDRRHTVYGRYQSSGEFSLVAGGEWDVNKKMEMSLTLKRQGTKSVDGQITIVTPFYGHENYGVSASYTNQNRQHEITLEYQNPQNKAISAKGSLNYNSPLNFYVEASATSPFYGFRDVSAQIRQTYDYRRISTNIECNWSRQRMQLHIQNNFNSTHYFGNIDIRSPYDILREVRTSYSFMNSRSERQTNLDLTYNGVKQFKTEIFFNKVTSRGYNCQVLLDIPRIPYSLSVNRMLSKSEGKVTMRSIYLSRTMSLNTIYQNAGGSILNEAKFSWNEEANKFASYAFKTNQIQTRTSQGTEVYGRVDLPIRSFEVKGNIAKLGNSMGLDFYWDASGDREKHLTVGYEHHDLSNKDEFAQKVRFILSHPHLPKDIMLTNIFTMSSSEIHLKSDLEYSRHQHHHLSVELRASDLSADQRERHYKAELSMRQPSSFTDFRLVGEVNTNRQSSSAHFRINNMGNDKVQRVKEIKGKLIKATKSVHITMRSDDSQMNLFGKRFNKGYEVVLTPLENGNDLTAALGILRYSVNDDSLDLKFSSTGNNGFLISVAYPRDSVSLKITHTQGNNIITDAYVFIGLEQSRVLRSRINWRSEAWRELKGATGEELNMLSHFVTKHTKLVWNNIKDEISYKSSLMGSNMGEHLKPFIKEISHDLSALSKDMAIARVTMHNMYKNNEFFMQDLAKFIEMVSKRAEVIFGDISMIAEVLYNTMVMYLDDLYYEIYYAIEDFSESARVFCRNAVNRCLQYAQNAEVVIYRSWRWTLSQFDHAMNYICWKIQDLWDVAIKNIDNALRSYAPFVIDMYYYAKNVADAVREKINSFSDHITNSFTNNVYYITLVDYWGRVTATIEAFQRMEVMSTIQRHILRQYAVVRGTAEVVLQKLSEMNILEAVKNHPHVEYASDVTNRALIKSMEIYDALGVDAMLRSLFNMGIEYTRNIVMDTAQDLLHELYQLKSGVKYDIHPENGIIAFEYILPIARNSLIEALDIRSYPEYQKVSDLKNNFVNKYYEDFCIWDMYYAAKKYFSYQSWTPLQTAHAMVAGNQHFVTFDKFSFDFAGHCSYLLTRDFVDGNFSVVVNYVRDGQRAVRKSLTVLSDGKRLEVANDYKVTVDDTKVELPIQRGDTTVMREGSNIRIENEPKGFAVVCNFVHDVCTLGMSGFYFGKTGGLFGTYDYESRLDMMTPERRLAEDVESFVNSWEVGAANCKRTSNMATVAGNDYRVNKKCGELFSTSSSSFRPCFKQVDPKSYMKMCISDLSIERESQFDSAICTSAAAYWTECNLQGIPLKMPKSCVRCEAANQKEMTQGDVIKFTKYDPLNTADIVFVVEEKQCNAQKFGILSKFAQATEDAFRQKGYKDIRYSVVGFGGGGVHSKPHIHTMDGQEHGSIRAVESAFLSLEAGEGPVNILEALRYAAALRFRPGTTKSFVLVKCSTCEAEEVRAEYGEMVRTLLDGDITLHLLMEQNLELKTPIKSQKIKRIIGLDRNYAYTLKDMKDSQLRGGDGDLLAQLKIPKDVCVPLALEVNGSSFDSQLLLETKKNTHKKFMDVVARRMSKSASIRSDWAMCCECIANVDGVGKSACQRCVSAEVANMITPETSSLYNPMPSPKQQRYDSREDSSEERLPKVTRPKHKGRRGKTLI